MAEQSAQGVAGYGERGERGPCRTSAVTLFSSGTRENDMGRRNKVGLCLPI